jgi:malate synthase
MGGMAAQIPIKDDPEANERALAKVRADKLREVSMGHDGTWVAHPGLVPIAREIFDAHMKGINQLDKKTASTVGQKELLAVPEGNRTEAGLRHNIRVGIQYIAAWLRGQDAATAEISRAQVWQWVAHGAPVTRTDGSSRPVTREELARIVNDEARPFSDGEQMNAAKDLFLRLVTAPEFEEFLTLPAYEKIAEA